MCPRTRSSPPSTRYASRRNSSRPSQTSSATHSSMSTMRTLLVDSVSKQTRHILYKYVSLKSGGIPLLVSIVVVVSVDPVRIPGLLIRPNGTSLLRSQLRIAIAIHSYSSHLRQHGRRLNLVSVLLEHRRELRGKLLHHVVVALRLAEADGVLLAVELQLHHVVRIAEAPVAGEAVSPLTMRSYPSHTETNATVRHPAHVPRERLLLSLLNGVINLENLDLEVRSHASLPPCGSSRTREQGSVS